MLQQSLLLAALPSAVLDMTTDFAPLFMGMVIGLFLSVLAFAFAMGTYDSWRPPLSETHLDDRSASEPEFSDAA
jgi:hypothetical protein